MKSMKMKSGYFKYISIALVAVFLIAAALLLLNAWEAQRGRFHAAQTDPGTVSYNGQEYVRKDGIETFLVLGLDRYEGAEASDSHGSGVQADFLMLFVFDNEKKQTTAVHINRDAMTKVNKLSVGGTSVVETYTKQIALAYNYVNDDNDKIRCRNTKDSVEFLMKGMKVDHYLSLTMDFVSASCDFVGGVEVTVLDDFTDVDDSLVAGQKVTLTGEQALAYVRTRYGLDDSTNNARMARQQQYINALYSKIISRIEADKEFAVDLLETMDEYIVYDSSDEKMQKFVEKFRDYQFMGIRQLDGRMERGQEFMEFYPDEASIWEIAVDLFYTPKTGDDK